MLNLMEITASRTDDVADDLKVEVQALLVDDNRFDRRRIIHEAERAGLNIRFTEAANCAEARAQAAEQEFGLFILDYSLPDGDGLALAREITANDLTSGAPVIMIAGQGVAQIAVEAMRAGCADYLIKGAVNSESLVRAILNALEKSRLTRERNVAVAEKDVFKSVLDRFAKDCVSEMKPAVMRLTRQVHDLPDSSAVAGRKADPKILELVESCRLLQDFLEEIERYGQDGK